MFLAMMGSIVFADAQELVEFKLQRSGAFLTAAGEEYAVVEFQGKTEVLVDGLICSAQQRL